MPPRVVGLAGWYAAAFTSSTDSGTNGFQTLRGSDGSRTAPAFYSFGTDGNSDRALGTLPNTGGTVYGALRLGVRFVNNTGRVITGFTFSYDGEQWGAANISSAPALNNQFTFSYNVFGAGLGTLANSAYTGAYTDDANGDFNTPHDGVAATPTGTSTALDGNAAGNRIAGIGDTIAGLSVAAGEEIWLRWSDAATANNAMAIGIDNFTVAFAVPEPTSVALVGMGASLIWCQLRRRK